MSVNLKRDLRGFLMPAGLIVISKKNFSLWLSIPRDGMNFLRNLFDRI